MNPKYILLVTVPIITLFMGCNQKNMNIDGLLLIPMSLRLNTNTGIYAINLKDNNIEPYFKSEEYTEINYPENINGKFYCIAKSLQNGNYILLENSHDRVRKLLTFDTRVYFYTFLSNYEMIIIKEFNGAPRLFKYSLHKGKVESVFNYVIDKLSKPIVTQDKSIIFVAIEDRKYIIKSLSKEGVVQTIDYGRFPILLKENSLIFSHADKLLKMDLSTKRKKILKKNIILKGTPVVSPNHEYIAFFEQVFAAPYTSEITEVLTVFSLKDHEKQVIKAYNSAKITLEWKGLLWINKSKD